MKPLILGIAGLALTDDERALFRAADPAGYILFKRNIDSPEQVRALTAELGALSGQRRVPILIDQEGGRVARLAGPQWPAFPPAQIFGAAYLRAPITAMEAARLNARAIAAVLVDLGINVDCLPVLDLAHPGAHDVVGDRAFGSDPDTVAALGDATLRGLREGGIAGIVKHVPGHGRAAADSHHEMPVVAESAKELAADFEPFRRLRAAPMAMTAHVTYTALDPAACASQSAAVIDFIRTEIGIDGLLMSDDIGMNALSGGLSTRLSGVLDAGCDIALHCSGLLAENAELCAAAPEIAPAAADRLERAMRWAAPPAPGDVAALAEARDRLLAA